MSLAERNAPRGGGPGPRHHGNSGMQHFDIYDRPGWNSFTYTYPHWGGIEKRENGRVVIRFDTADATAYNDDFYFRHYREVAMVSDDGCRTWELFQPDWSHQVPLHVSDGTQLEVVQGRDLVPREVQRRRVKDLGIGHVWRDDCRLAWDLWPRRMTGSFAVSKHRKGTGLRYLRLARAAVCILGLSFVRWHLQRC